MIRPRRRRDEDANASDGAVIDERIRSAGRHCADTGEEPTASWTIC
jgi:hypothetical protein